MLYWQRSKTRTAMLSKENLKLQAQKYKDEILINQKEISTNLLRLAEKNEVITSTVKTLKESASNFTSPNKRLIGSVISELESRESTGLWQRFEHSFTKLHAQFYTNLNNKHSNLTPNERRLCAFVKLNFSTKDIATILHMPASSVEKARVRLRKKLGIVNSKTSLVEYISDF